MAIPILRNAFDVENKLVSTASFFVKVLGPPPLLERRGPSFGSLNLPVFNLMRDQKCFFHSIGKSANVVHHQNIFVLIDAPDILKVQFPVSHRPVHSSNDLTPFVLRQRCTALMPHKLVIRMKQLKLLIRGVRVKGFFNFLYIDMRTFLKTNCDMKTRG